MNLSLKKLAGLALLAALVGGGSLYAQVYGARGYNPYTGTYAQGGTAYNPYTGTAVKGGTAYNPYTGGYKSETESVNRAGTEEVSKTYHNPYTGTTEHVQGAYNPYTGRYAVHGGAYRR
jgi:hypothetical protein